jgi:hypothetical protein
MAAIECKLAMCISSRLVKFELLLELKVEQKRYFTAYLVLKDASSLKTVCARTERLSVPVIYFDIRAYNDSDLALYNYDFNGILLATTMKSRKAPNLVAAYTKNYTNNY